MYCLTSVQKESLRLLTEFDRLCKGCHLQYWLAGGTLLGAIRHKGFIPWDDDIDVAIPREDYNKFLEYAKTELDDKYVIMNCEYDSNYPLMTTRIMLKNTEFREEALKDIKCHLGIFLDVYPFDKISDDPKEFKKQARDAWFWSKMLILRSIPFPVLGFKGFKAKLVHAACAVVHFLMVVFRISKKWLYKKCYEASTRYNHYEKTEKLDFLCDTTPYMNIYKVSDIYPLEKKPFEDIMLNFPRSMHENLTGMYGDYMQLPPEDKRKNHFPYSLKFEDEFDKNDTGLN